MQRACHPVVRGACSNEQSSRRPLFVLDHKSCLCAVFCSKNGCAENRRNCAFSAPRFLLQFGRETARSSLFVEVDVARGRAASTHHCDGSEPCCKSRWAVEDRTQGPGALRSTALSSRCFTCNTIMLPSWRSQSATRPHARDTSEALHLVLAGVPQRSFHTNFGPRLRPL